MAKSAEEIKAALEQPFGSSDIKWRQGAGGMQLAYLDGPTVYRRLNSATNSWDFVVERSFFDGMDGKNGVDKVMIVEGHLHIPELGKRAGTGVQVLKPGSGEDMYKGARTDAIKNAASLFGVGLELYEGFHLAPKQSAPPSHPEWQRQDPHPTDPAYNQNRQQSGGDDYVPMEMQYPPQQQGGYQQQPQQGQYQRATGDRVPGGATVKQIGAIKAIADSKNIDPETLSGIIAKHNDGDMSTDSLNSRAASNIIGELNSLP